MVEADETVENIITCSNTQKAEIKPFKELRTKLKLLLVKKQEEEE